MCLSLKDEFEHVALNHPTSVCVGVGTFVFPDHSKRQKIHETLSLMDQMVDKRKIVSDRWNMADPRIIITDGSQLQNKY